MENDFTSHEQKAYDLFCSGCNCAQATFAAFCDVTGYNTEEAMKLASSFGGGMGGMRGVCGALSGIFMVCGHLYGYAVDPEKGESAEKNVIKQEHYKRIRRLADEFKACHSTIMCGELLGNLAKNPPAAARTDEYYRVRPCAAFCRTAARLMDNMIKETEQKEKVPQNAEE